MINFRNAQLHDLSQIVDIYNSIIPGRMVTADTEPVSVESRVEWFNSHHSKRPLLVGEVDGKVIGFLSFKSFYGRPAYNGTVEIAIYLAENERGKGFGKLFLQKAIDLAPSLEIKTILGFIFAHNTPSIKLFKQFGFEEYGHLPKVAVMDGKEYDLVILGKKI